MNCFDKITFRMDKEDRRELKAYLALIDCSMQKFINKAIKEKIERDIRNQQED